MSNYIIRIPEPCHEDWNKMNPDEKGRFCKSCSKSVYDFTTKSDNEIHHILNETKGQHICGHFKKSQIDRPLTISLPIQRLPFGISPSRAFAIALFFVFGTFLFSCTSETGRTVGKIELVDPASLGKNISDESAEITIRGSRIVEPVEITGEFVTPIVDEKFVNGGVGFYREAFDPITGDIEIVEVPDTLITTVTSTNETTEQTEQFYLGGLVAIEQVESIQTDNSEQSGAVQSELKTDLSKLMNFSCSAYPNPSTGSVNISYELKERMPVQIDIFNMEGKAVMNIVPKQEQHTGKYIIPTDLSSLPNGTYLCRLSANGNEKTTKIILWK
jgi:hypothetical protein